MKAEQVDQALHQKFVTEDERLVFWHDPDREFWGYVEAGLDGELGDVQVLDVAKLGGLSTKLRLEQEDRSGKYLVYSYGEIPVAENDWLLDIRIYSAEFHADVASLWVQFLGLNRLSLREHLGKRAAFMRSQARCERLKRLIDANDDEAVIDLKMMAVLVGSSVASAFDVLRNLCHGHEQDGEFDLGEQPEAMTSFEKMGLLERFWGMMRDEFAYTSDAPLLGGLLRRLFVSELFNQANGSELSSLAHHELANAGKQNAVVFLTQWRDSKGKESSYDAVAGAVSAEQNVNKILASFDLETIREVYTFWGAEKLVVKMLKERLLTETESLNVDFVKAIASERRAGHWLTDPKDDQLDRIAISDSYIAIVAAAELFALCRTHRQSLSFDTPRDLLSAYVKELHKFDRLYRCFCSRAQASHGQGRDLLKTLADEVERVYTQGFLQPFGVEWSRLLDSGFLETWSADGFPAQQDFYNANVRPLLAGSDRKRAYVIISDAFRYEAAAELTEALNSRYRMDAKLTPMLGVLPSYTELGMASLLPHSKLEYNAEGKVLVDGKSTAGTEARSKQLATVQGMACQAKELRRMKKGEAREFTDGKKVVYIYHDVIDRIGDKAPTEEGTFDAVSDCIEELVELVGFCVNSLNAGKVWVTADHGFLFRQDGPSEMEKSKLGYIPEHAAITKKRYVIGPDLGRAPEAHHGSIEVTSGAKGGMEFWVPRAANRFHFVGGARFVHGGAMPQEVVVPLVTVTHVRGKKKEGSPAPLVEA